MIKRFKRSAKILSGAVHELSANLVAAQLYPFGILERNEKPKVHSKLAHNPRPILLVHGILHNRSAFVSLKRKMTRMGWENIYTINYRTLGRNVLSMADDLAEKVEAILKHTGAPQIDIVAHSLGGIVSRTYMSLGKGRGNVRRLVTLGTPHQGTQLSFIAKGFKRAALDYDLKINSFLIRLLTETRLPKESEVVSIYSPFDWTVVPGENGAAVGLPSNSFKNIRLEYTGHTGLLYSNDAFDAIVQNLLAK